MISMENMPQGFMGKQGFMEKNAVKKLRETCGETLTETLCAILITALAAALLTALPGVAVRLNKMADERDRELYGALSAAEAAAEPLTELAGKSVTVDLTSDTGEASAVFEDISVYGKEGVVISYGWEDAE